MSLRSGAPRLLEPLPRYVWQVRQPDWANRFAPGTAAGGRLFSFTQVGQRPTSSLPSASFAVAPFQVSVPIAITVRIVITTATGRRESRRSCRRSRNGRASIRTMMIVGIPTVPRITESGHLKIRSR